jgi:hypothetical protein
MERFGLLHWPSSIPRTLASVQVQNDACRFATSLPYLAGASPKSALSGTPGPSSPSWLPPPLSATMPHGVGAGSPRSSWYEQCLVAGAAASPGQCCSGMPWSCPVLWLAACRLWPAIIMPPLAVIWSRPMCAGLRAACSLQGRRGEGPAGASRAPEVPGNTLHRAADGNQDWSSSPCHAISNFPLLLLAVLCEPNGNSCHRFQPAA